MEKAPLTTEQKKFIKENFNAMKFDDITKMLGISDKQLWDYAKTIPMSEYAKKQLGTENNF